MTPAVLALWLAMAGPTDAYPVTGVAISFEPIVYSYADANLVPRWLAMRVAFAESSFRPRAVSGSSRGLFQVNRRWEKSHATAAGISGFRWWHPGDSARAGLTYLGKLIRQYDGDLMLAVASYNAGPGRMASAKPIPKETINHLRRVFK